LLLIYNYAKSAYWYRYLYSNLVHWYWYMLLTAECEAYVTYDDDDDDDDDMLACAIKLAAKPA